MKFGKILLLLNKIFFSTRGSEAISELSSSIHLTIHPSNHLTIRLLIFSSQIHYSIHFPFIFIHPPSHPLIIPSIPHLIHPLFHTAILPSFLSFIIPSRFLSIPSLFIHLLLIFFPQNYYSIYLPTHSTAPQFCNLSICLFTHLSTHSSFTYLSIHPSIHISVLSIHTSIHQSNSSVSSHHSFIIKPIHSSTHISIYPFIQGGMTEMLLLLVRYGENI